MPLELRRLYFKYFGNYETSSVDLVGSFNQWKEGLNALNDDDGDNCWEGFIDLPEGKYEYKFLVNKKDYVIDAANPLTLTSEGITNSVLTIGGINTGKAVIHESFWIDEFKKDFIYIKIALGRGGFNHAKLILLINEQPKAITGYELYWDDSYSYYIFQFRNGTPINDFLYYFEIIDKDNKTLYFGKNGIIDSEWEVEHFEYIKSGLPVLQTPQWVRGAVFYQIFPDRFYSSGSKNNSAARRRPDEKPLSDSFYGGNIAGIIAKADHLKNLGINAVYFNPLFEATTNHKYNTKDYMKIDPDFGDDEIYKSLAEIFKADGIRFILDGVFNHTGTEFFAFRDIEQNGASSKYYKWYNIKKLPLVENGKPNYECWWNIASLPKLNTRDPGVRDYIYNCAEEWLKRGSSGWRLDVPNEIGHEFWKEFRNRVKSVREDSYIVGEIWKDAEDWLKGDEFDAVMNYRLRDSCVGFFARREKSSEDFVKETGNLIFSYPMQANFAMLNLLSSHDTARFYTVAEKDIARLKLAVVFLFTFIGAPCIYYGEEIGMEGGKDPDNRRFMVWAEKKWDMEIFNFYKRMICIRKENSILTDGDFRFIYSHEMVIGYERFTNDGKLVIFINNSQKSVHIDVTKYFGNGDFTDISKDHPLKRKKAYTLYENEFVILKKMKDR